MAKRYTVDGMHLGEVTVRKLTSRQLQVAEAAARAAASTHGDDAKATYCGHVLRLGLVDDVLKRRLGVDGQGAPSQPLADEDGAAMQSIAAGILALSSKGGA